ncbi:hypothetical protein BJ166DRAFT_525006 [Pestalotiopsis sp. NC0098]|nr:hypothetical protein BJ166DRAFT_525006 [Pestalotiopsis sp. NC0098]
MCRLVLFSGSCTRCGGDFHWEDLSQQLPCLEAKNNGIFGECRNGVNMDQHAFDQECDACMDDESPVQQKTSEKGKKRQRTR